MFKNNNIRRNGAATVAVTAPVGTGRPMNFLCQGLNIKDLLI